MTSESPTIAVAFFDHGLAAETDHVQIPNFEARMMKPGPIRLNDGGRVVVTAPRRTQKRDQTSRGIGQLQPKDALKEIGLFI